MKDRGIATRKFASEAQIRAMFFLEKQQYPKHPGLSSYLHANDVTQGKDRLIQLHPSGCQNSFLQPSELQQMGNKMLCSLQHNTHLGHILVLTIVGSVIYQLSHIVIVKSSID